MKRVTKSVTALLLALVLSLTLLPAQALAADTAPAQTTYIGSYVNPAYAGKIGIPRRQSTLSVQTAQITQPKKAGTVYTKEAEAAADLRKQMVSRSEVMSVTLRSARDDMLTLAADLWDLALDHVEGSGTTGDYLRWQHTGMSGSVEGESLDSGYRYTFTYVPDTRYFDTIWFTTNAQEKALTNYIQNTILPQLSLGGKTTYQKVQAIYNWITANVKYDYSHMNDPTYWPQYTAYAAAVQKKAVCQGYANLFYRLANDAGVDCRIITGKAYNDDGTADHAWNIVRMEDEKYYCLDATWDAGLKPENYEYFLKGLTSFSRDHQAETDKLNTPYWTQYQSRTSATDYKASSTQLSAPTVTGGKDSQGRPTLKWNAVSGAAKYEVYRSYSENGTYTKYSTTTGTSYTNTGYIENGNTYYYKVRALDAKGTAGAWSSIVSVTYKQTLPAPTVTGGNDSQGRPTLTWKAVSGAAKYEVYRARSKDGDYIKYSTVTGTSYTNTSYIENGNTYYYRVRALNSSGVAGAWSSVVSVTYKQTLPAPTVTGGNDAQGRPTLKWNAVTGAAKYEVYRARSLNGDYIKYSTVTGTSYTNTSYIEDGNTYYYKVRALKSDGTAGAWSSVVSVTYKQTLSAPTVTGGNDAQGRPTLKWNAVSGAAKYEVYRARSMNGDYIKYSTVTGTSYTNTSYIENGNTYYYKVRALDANGTAGAWSSVVSVTYKQTLSAPAVTGGNDSQGRPTLKWNTVTGAAKYEVYRARSRSGEYIKYSTVTGTSYTNISYIENGNTYYYKVRALDANGTAGAWSSIVSVTYRAASTGTLSAPTVTGGNDSQGRPTLKWNAVTGAAKYEVYRARSKDGDYIKYSTVTGTSYTNTSYIENGNTYYYKVRALKSDGTAGAWSSIVSVTYRAASTGTLPAPTVTGGNDAQGRPTLKWNAVTGAAKYEVYRARSKDGDYIKYSTVTGTSYTNTSYIENGNTYYYKVRALKSDGTAGAWSSIVSVTYRKPAAATAASGKCGDSAKWTLDAAGTLTISGTGRMYDYEWPADRGGTTPPWLANKYRDSIRTLRVEQGITYIGRCAFDSCSNLSDVTLPTSLRIIGPWAFNDCTALRSIQLPEGLTTIKEDAFKAAGLVSITFPSTLRELRNGAFMNCEKLQSLRLPEGLTTIGVWAFYCNPNISSIYIPASVTMIGEEAFIYYNNLATVRYGGSQSQWNAVSVAANAFPDGVCYVYNVN